MWRWVSKIGGVRSTRLYTSTEIKKARASHARYAGMGGHVLVEPGREWRFNLSDVPPLLGFG